MRPIVRVEDDEIQFDIFKAMHDPRDKGQCFQINILEEICSGQLQPDNSWDTQEQNLEDGEKEQLIRNPSDNQISPELDQGYNQIDVDPQDQEKTKFTCPFGVYIYRKMPFGLCNAPTTFQRCMLAIFADLVEKCIEVFMDDFFVFGDSFDICLKNLEIVSERCVETNLILNWEKCHIMVTEGIFLGHKISRKGIEEFNLEIRDKSGRDNLVADHLSRLINEEATKGEREIVEAFPDEKLFLLQNRPWFADIANYKASGIIPNHFNY
ncbi:PREDICTED: uncharacterized protein LOC109346926 [Lupinus angustifolius]|uniref:uncharacterized protein LOC109346926 n=1 Tax=Lupinus angustifolius TaxID=3871 RepID=UPI00092F5617|nr:PREDICTED: uncharacterized protein LOC109346926 [Lupinus angustifolius]